MQLKGAVALDELDELDEELLEEELEEELDEELEDDELLEEEDGSEGNWLNWANAGVGIMIDATAGRRYDATVNISLRVIGRNAAGSGWARSPA